MTRRIPIIPTIIVLAAAATMVALGVWQLGRAEWKGVLIAQYEEALASDEELSELPRNAHEDRWDLYRKINVECREVLEWRATAGRNASDETGYAHIARCEDRTLFGFDGDPDEQFLFEVALGWSRDPASPIWEGGQVTGRLVSGGSIPKVQADVPLEGLEAMAEPDPNDLPNNHLAYAFQWFFFALTALVIYVLALRKRWLAQDQASD